MRVFVTGSTGFIGAYLVPELIKAGHKVVGLTRSDTGAEALTRAGAEVFRGDVNDLERVRRAAAAADGVIHAAFNHDFTRLKESCEEDRKVIEALGQALAGSDRPLVVTSGTGVARRSKTGALALESDDHVTSAEAPRAAAEEAAGALIDKGGRVMVMRLPQVHDTRRFGRINLHIQLARQNGRVGYVGEGKNRLAAVHVSDAAHLFRLVQGRRPLPRRRRGRRCHARHRRSDRYKIETAGRVNPAGEGAGLLRLVGRPRRPRYGRLWRRDAEGAGVESNGAGPAD